MGNEQDLFNDIENMIMEEARKSYSSVVIDHYTHPRNVGEMVDADCYTYMSGICGDTIGIYVRIENDRLKHLSFVTNGCGTTVACGSALTCMAEGMMLTDAKQLTGKDLIEYLDGLPLEHTHCADLAVNTLRGALEKANGGQT
jgi:nitrogen fixation NifU-like protein